MKSNLKGAYDVIVITPGRERQAAGVRHRVARAAGAYQKSEQFKNLRDVRRVGRHHGSMGVEGVAELDKFVKPAACW